MSARSDVLLWAQRVVGRKAASADQILDIPPGSRIDVIQAAFHKIARMGHPDLYRTALTAEELELVTTAYARAAAAYQELRSQRPTTMRLPGGPGGSSPALVPAPGGAPCDEVVVPSDPEVINPAQAMTSKALIYYRKAELCLRRGDLTSAVLQLKMAIASDPQSRFLRGALAEVQAEVGKMP
jgi:hypothetical protein